MLCPPSTENHELAMESDNTLLWVLRDRLKLTGNKFGCGITVNTDLRAQLEDAIVYRPTATLKGSIKIAGGQIQQHNFDDYPLLRLDECPAIDVHIVSSAHDADGVGEPSVPPAAPAWANAVFALTERQVRSLPIRL